MVTKNSGYLTQSNFGTKGHFEVVVDGPSGLQRWSRNNDDPNLPWISTSVISTI
ncbi:MAG: hypothetical protein M3275_00715 [Thermoproteota archaeon]|nr:hypothetical protein [Thermoproteota archaeon]